MFTPIQDPLLVVRGKQSHHREQHGVFGRFWIRDQVNQRRASRGPFTSLKRLDSVIADEGQ